MKIQETLVHLGAAAAIASACTSAPPILAQQVTGPERGPRSGVFDVSRSSTWAGALAQESPMPYRGTKAGFAVGALLPQLVLPVGLSGSSCFGSGDYLTLCRLMYVGATAVSGGIGALIGRSVGREEPPGVLANTVFGAALGAMSGFVLTLPTCSQEDDDNPAVLCDYDGFISPHTALFAAGAGGLVAYLLHGREPRGALRVTPSPFGRGIATGWSLPLE